VTSGIELILALAEFTHLEVDMSLLDEVTLLNARFSLQDQILHVVVHSHWLVETARACRKWDGRGLQNCNFAAHADTSEWILYYGP